MGSVNWIIIDLTFIWEIFWCTVWWIYDQTWLLTAESDNSSDQSVRFGRQTLNRQPFQDCYERYINCPINGLTVPKICQCWWDTFPVAVCCIDRLLPNETTGIVLNLRCWLRCFHWIHLCWGKLTGRFDLTDILAVSVGVERRGCDLSFDRADCSWGFPLFSCCSICNSAHTGRRLSVWRHALLSLFFTSHDSFAFHTYHTDH